MEEPSEQPPAPSLEPPQQQQPSPSAASDQASSSDARPPSSPSTAVVNEAGGEEHAHDGTTTTTTATPPPSLRSPSLSSPSTGAASPSTGPASQAPGVGGGVVEDQLSKFKRLLTLSRQRLEENQRALAEKDGHLALLAKEGEALRARVAQLQQQVQEAQKQQQKQQQRGQGAGGVIAGVNVTPPPRRALLRVDVEGRIWLLLEPEGDGEASGERDYWRSFGSEAEAAAFLAPPGRPPIPPGSLASLPPCLGPFDSARVQAEAKASVERAKEELRRYRVRHEMLLRGKEAEIKQLSAAALAQQTQRIDGAGTTQDGEELQRQVKAQAEKIAALRQELAETEQRWRAACEKAVREKEALLDGAGSMDGGAGGGAAALDTALASQWRRRYESVVREKEDLRSRLDMSSGSGTSMTGEEQKYKELKEEYRLYRKQALAALKEKDAAIANLKGGGSGGGGGNGGAAGAGLNLQDPSVQYLRNLCERFFSTESPEIRLHTERAMCTVLRFSEEEMRRMREARGAAVSGANSGAGIAGDVTQWASSLFASTTGGGNR